MNLLTDIKAHQRSLARRWRGKGALADLYPDLAAREHLYSSAAGGWAAEADSYVGAAQLYHSYVWVRKAVSLIVQNIAPLPVRVVRADGTLVPGHPLTALYAEPNDTMPPAEFWGRCTIHLLLGGESFREIVDDARGRPRELWPRRPDRVAIAPDGTRAAYPTPAAYVLEDLGTPTFDGRVPPTAVVHELFLNPLSEWRGLGPIPAVMMGIANDLLAQAQAKHFFGNLARPDYAVTSKDALAPAERERLEAMLVAKYRGNSNLPIVLEYGQDVKPLSFPQKDVMALEQRGVTRDEVAAIFGIPDILMGFGADSYDTEEKRTAAMSTLWALTLLPLVRQRDATETHFWTTVRPLLRPGERLATDLTDIAVLQEDLGPKLDHLDKLWTKGVPFNVLDKVLRLGIGAIPGGDVGYLPAGVAPLAAAAPADPGVAASAASAPPILGYHIESGVVSRNEARAQLGLQPEDETTDDKLRRLQGQLSVALAAVNVGIDTQQALGLVGIDLTVPPPQQLSADVLTKGRRPAAQRAAGALLRVRVSVARRMERAIERAFADLADRIVDRARQAAKAIAKSLTVDDLLWPDDGSALETLFRQFAIEVCSASWETWNSALGLAIAFDESDPAVVAALSGAGRNVRGITETTRTFLARLLQESADAGLSIQEMIPGIRLVIEESYAGRARTIARTETAQAQAAATVARYRGAGVARVVIFDGGADDSDDACNALNGTTQTLDWYHQNPIGHPNCTRAAGPSYE